MRISSTTPFELTFSYGVWSANWVAEDVGVVVAGSDDAPHPAHAATLRDLVERWAEVRRATYEVVLDAGQPIAISAFAS